jgi:hypothetical protein
MIDHTTECQWNDINHMHLGKNKSTLIPKDIMYSKKKGVRACNTHTHTHTVSGRDPNPTQSNPSILQKKNRRDQEQLKSPRRP